MSKLLSISNISEVKFDNSLKLWQSFENFNHFLSEIKINVNLWSENNKFNRDNKQEKFFNGWISILF